MYKQLSLAILCCAICLGCADSSQPFNVTENADQQAIDNYNAMIKEAEMRDSATEASPVTKAN